MKTIYKMLKRWGFTVKHVATRMTRKRVVPEMRLSESSYPSKSSPERVYEDALFDRIEALCSDPPNRLAF